MNTTKMKIETGCSKLMIKYSLTREERKCDHCGKWSLIKDTRTVVNPVIHEKDMLVFCRLSDCEKRYFVRRNLWRK